MSRLINMRKFGWALLLLACLPASAQVAVELVLEQNQFLRDQSLPVKVRIVNRSGQTLKLGETLDWLDFQVENRDGKPVIQREPPAIQDAFELESASAATRRVDLMPSFVLQPGRYKVTVMLRLKEWGQEIASKPQNFDIIPGFKVWEQEVGVPVKDAPPEVRRYSLQQATYLKRLLLYARLTDKDDIRVFRVQPLGPLVSFSKPEAQIDKASNLHVLFQSGARSFYYVVVSPSGDVLQRETHDYAGKSRPVLRAGENGTFYVAGGARRRSADDLPATPANTDTSAGPTGATKLAGPSAIPSP
jgi:hypothetical protein